MYVETYLHNVSYVEEFLSLGNAIYSILFFKIKLIVLEMQVIKNKALLLKKKQNKVCIPLKKSEKRDLYVKKKSN